MMAMDDPVSSAMRIQSLPLDNGIKGQLKNDTRKHTGDKPYKYLFCHKSFAEGCNLKTHMRTHTGEKPYKCQLCQKSFAQGSTLKIHMRTHSGERPYRCQLCHKSFAEGCNLTTHMRTHSGEKPYIRAVCNRRFTKIGNIMTYRKISATDKENTSHESCARSSSSAEHFQLQRVIQPQDIKIESESVAEIFWDVKPFLEKSFGCGVCGEMLEVEKEFLEHCFGHCFSPPDDLLVALC